MRSTDQMAPAEPAPVSCRCCGGRQLLPVLDLGQMPLTAAFRKPADLNRPERRYPLEVGFCPNCSLVQILYTVPPEEVFHAEYPYYSSFSDALLRHARDNVLEILASRPLNSDSLVVEVGSNDGYLLKNFVERSVPVLGIDPSPGPVAAAIRAGVPSLQAFFGESLARKLVAEGKRADIIIANNVMAHVADTNGFVKGIATLLKDDGVLVSESPYLRDLVNRCEFDTIYHEHLCYYSVSSLNYLLRRNGLVLSDVRPLSIHGGSLRIFAGPKAAQGESVRRYLAAEEHDGLCSHQYYRDFADRVREVRRSLRQLLSKLKQAGKRIAAYGAAAKGVVLLNYAGIGPETIDYVVDRNVHKQGLYLPGAGIPVCDPSRLVQDMPDYVLILAWNFADEVMLQQKAYSEKGGRFIVPIPTPRVYEKTLLEVR